MNSDWAVYTVAALQEGNRLFVEDGNHGQYRPRPNEFVADGTAFIRAGDMVDGKILFDSADTINETALNRIRKGFGRPCDVILSSKGTVGKVALAAPDSPPFVCSPQTTFWRSLDPDFLDYRYLHCFLRSPEFHRQLSAIKGETDMADYASLTAQRRLSVVVPPIDEQRAIAHILGALDDKIELNRKMNETLEAMARAVFKSWFVDFDPVVAKSEGREPVGMDAQTAALFPDSFRASELGPVPKGWEVEPLPEAVEVNPKRPLKKGDVAPYLDMANMPTTSARATNIIERPFGSGTKFTNGDSLVARITPCLENGKTAYVDFLEDGQAGWGSTEFIVLRPRPPLPTEFAYFLARTEEFRGFAVANMTGTSGRQRVPPTCLANFSLVVPPEGIAQRFGETARGILCKMKANDGESSTLASIRDSLLPKLLSGQIRVKGAEGAVP